MKAEDLIIEEQEFWAVVLRVGGMWLKLYCEKFIKA